MKLISPSRLAVESAKFNPIGNPATHDGMCKACGFSHKAGELVIKENIGDFFNNFSDLAAPSSKVFCGYCAVTFIEPWTQAWMNAAITEDGVFKFASNNDIAHFLLNPPKGRFIYMRGSQMKQHLVWRTPVNYSQEAYQLRFGEKIFTIRTSHLKRAAEAARELSSLMTSNNKKRKNQDVWVAKFTNPFISPVRDNNDYVAGRLKNDVLLLGETNESAAKQIAILNSCTPGEIWGLSAVLYAKPIEAPTLHVLKVKEKDAEVTNV